MPVFFITAEQIRNGTVTITGELLNHLRASLRVRSGERIWTGDGGHRYLIEVTSVDRTTLRGRVLEECARPQLSHPSLILGQALLKGERMEWVIQKATELGVGTIVPLVTDQTIVRPKSTRRDSQQERWQRIAHEAAQQSERWDIPIVETPCEAAAFFARPQAAALRLILCERQAGENLASLVLPRDPSSHIVLAVGPEGGWREDEMTRARDAGFRAITLGSGILRAETATLAAFSILQSRVGALG